MKRKSIYIKLIPVLFLVVGFFIVSELFKEKELTSFAFDDEQFKVAQSEKELNKMLGNQIKSIDPETMELIEKHGLMDRYENIQIPIMEQQRDLHIESIWNDGLGLLLTYSFSLLPSDQGSSEVPYLSMDQISFEAEGHVPIELTVIDSGPSHFKNWTNEGVVFKDRLYRRVMIQPDYDETIFKTLSSWVSNEQNYKHAQKAITKISRIRFHGVRTVKMVNREEQDHPLDDIVLDYTMDSWNPVIETHEVNQRLELGNGIYIKLTDYENRLYHSRLYMDIGSSHPFSQLKIAVGDQKDFTPVLTDADGRQFISFEHNERMAENRMEIELLAGVYHTDEELVFSITNEELNGFRHALDNGKIHYPLNKTGVINGINLNMPEIRKVEQGPGINYGFNIFMDSSMSEFPHLYLENYTQFVENMKTHFDFEEIMESQAFFEVLDEERSPVKLNLYHMYSNGGGQFFGVEKSVFDQLGEINVRLFNIPNQVDFDKNKVIINQ